MKFQDQVREIQTGHVHDFVVAHVAVTGEGDVGNAVEVAVFAVVDGVDAAGIARRVDVVDAPADPAARFVAVVRAADDELTVM